MTAEERAAAIAANCYRPRPMCRDCADHDGRCPNTDRLCDPQAQLALEIAQAIRSASSSTREAALREAAQVAKEWLAVFGGKEITYVPAQQYASGAVADIADAILSLISQPAPAQPAREAFEAMRGALCGARDAIANAPEDAWGTNATGDGSVPGGMMSWPIKDEILHYIDAALALADKAEPGETT